MTKAKITFWTALVTIISIVYLTVVPNFTTQATHLEVSHISAAESKPIFDATIQILVFRSAMLQSFDIQVGQGLSVEEMLSRGNGDLHYGMGLGTLVSHHGKTMLYTHDHWGDLDALGMVQFRSAAGELLLEMDGTAFRGMVRYQDGGTMVLGAAAQPGSTDYLAALVWNAQAKFNRVITPASFGTLQDVTAGQVVTVARQGRDGHASVEWIQAVVESIETRWGEQVYKLHSLNGETIVPGDSGGGIWLDGKVVGNMWKTDYTYRLNWETVKLEQTYKDTSFAAGLVAAVDEVAENLAASASGTASTSEMGVEVSESGDEF